MTDSIEVNETTSGPIQGRREVVQSYPIATYRRHLAELVHGGDIVQSLGTDPVLMGQLLMSLLAPESGSSLSKEMVRDRWVQNVRKQIKDWLTSGEIDALYFASDVATILVEDKANLFDYQIELTLTKAVHDD